MAYTLPAGIISESTNHRDMHGDFIGWMHSKQDLWAAMNDGRFWSEEDYLVGESGGDSCYAEAIFSAMADLTPLLPKDHMFGFSGGKLGIFHCPITIIVEEEPGVIPLARLLRLQRHIEAIEKAQKAIYGELLDIRDKAESYQDAESVWIAVASELASRMEAGKFSMGHILRQIARAISRRN